MLYTINTHEIDVPDCFTVNLDPWGPGAYDSLTYNEFEICTYEDSKLFAVYFDGGDFCVDLETLEDVKLFCDNFPASNLTATAMCEKLNIKFHNASKYNPLDE